MKKIKALAQTLPDQRRVDCEKIVGPVKRLGAWPVAALMVRKKVQKHGYHVERHRTLSVPRKSCGYRSGGILSTQNSHEVEYWHVICDAHEVIFSQQAMTESVHVGGHAQALLPPEAFADILSLFAHMRNVAPRFARYRDTNAPGSP